MHFYPSAKLRPQWGLNVFVSYKNKSLTLRGSNSWLSALLRLEIWELGAQNLPANLRLLIGKHALDSFLLYEVIIYSWDMCTNNQALRNTVMLEIILLYLGFLSVELNWMEDMRNKRTDFTGFTFLLIDTGDHTCGSYMSCDR